MITINNNLYSGKKVIIDIKLYQSLVMNFISDISNEDNTPKHLSYDFHSLCYFIMDLRNVYLMVKMMMV